MSDLTHNELCEIGAKWIRATKTCFFVDTEIHAPTGQIPDVLGLNFHHSIMIECKTSRSDFFADKKKNNYGSTTGKYRFYLCPPNIITPDDLEDGYGLLYAHGKIVKQVEPIIGAKQYMRKRWFAKGEELAIDLLPEAKNPNINEWCEYQIALKIIREHNIKKINQPCEKYNKAAFDKLKASHARTVKHLKETIDELRGKAA